MAPKQPTGFVLYEGPSLLDGSPIVAIALTGSSNRKTGNMVQTYILRRDMMPMEAVRTGADSAICGDCKHRPSTGGACYVVVAQGPTVVYKTWTRGGYPVALYADDLVAGRMVRLGTYGDPAAVPAHIWEELCSRASGRTGYTHQWATGAGSAQALQPLLMASADSAQERAAAVAQGWRTFRVMAQGEALQRGEFTCPASEEGGKRTTCAECGACDGAQRGAHKASPAIVVHGSKARRFITIRPA